jgi:hypothetical protein
LRCNFTRGWVEHIGGHDLLFQQRPVNQPVQDRRALLGSEIRQRLALKQAFDPDILVQLAFHDHAFVHHGNHAIHHLRRPGSNGEQHEPELNTQSHQNVCPILKKKLKCLST